ncbi:putative U box domain, armadillo-like helical, Zinc finger, RING/FYVE/PHD-type [Helianthus annuus]|nr:putative U box domain, armadillo-like helical, Zinc finger, RING/FYVE/PHD-type [Helianthus annuus]KAJ0505577.1 putative U box domain, armadillo-like helical, Zinc finger, RING/FYVE/PHD-type [Helianthus annuus]
MENSENEENLFALGEPKLHGEMCKTLTYIYVKALNVFPELEAARPRSTSGIQALCSLHIALDKTKTLLQHCAECSKIYLAITGDSVVLKFERARSALEDGLRSVENIVPQTIGCQISDVLRELEGIEFSLDPLEKQIGDEIIGLLQQGRNFSNNSDNNELEIFHTYERICIEKWFGDGHNTCPKTQQLLGHLGVTPNYCVKGLVASWCEHNGIVVPDGPPESLDLNYWRLSLSETESVNSKPVESGEMCKYKGMKVAPLPLEESDVIAEVEGDGDMTATVEHEGDVFETYDEYLAVLRTEDNLRKKCRVVEKIRRLLKDDEEARIYMGANGFVEALLRFLELGLREESGFAQESGAMALFNLAVNNNRNKETMLSAGLLSLLMQMIHGSKSVNAAIALYLNLSCLDQAKPVIGSSNAVPFLINALQDVFDSQCKTDSLHTLYHLSSFHPNIPTLIACGIIPALQPFITDPSSSSWTEKAIAVLINLAVTNSGRDEIVTSPGLVSGLSMLLDIGEPEVQEQAAACLLILCTGSDTCCEMVLQEGVIPSLVAISVNGTVRGKQKAEKLLMVFREQRQRDVPADRGGGGRCEGGEELKVLSKSTSRRKMGRGWSFMRKNKSFSVYQC